MTCLPIFSILATDDTTFLTDAQQILFFINLRAIIFEQTLHLQNLFKISREQYLTF